MSITTKQELQNTELKKTKVRMEDKKIKPSMRPRRIHPQNDTNKVQSIIRTKVNQSLATTHPTLSNKRTKKKQSVDVSEYQKEAIKITNQIKY